jgi:DNA-binding MarR family transcriptional regulator
LKIFTETTPGGSADTTGDRLHRHREPTAPGTVDIEPDVDLADQIIRLVRTWSSLKARMVSTVDPEVGTLFLLTRLIKDGPTRAKDLAEATCADQSTISRQVAALVKSGLIERQADPDDGRASILVPTPLGVAKVNAHFANRGRALEPLVAEWSDEEREQFVHLLGRFNSTLETRRDEVVRTMAHNHTRALVPPAARTESPAAAYQHTAHQESQPHPEHVHPHDSTERSN